MQRDQLPSMPWDCVAHVGATAHWPFIARAAYRELLCHQWIAGELPAEEARLAELIGLPESAFALVWPLFASEFEHTDSGALKHKHTDALRNEVLLQRETAQRLHEARVRGGLMTAARRWPAKAPKDSSATRPYVPIDSSATSSATPVDSSATKAQKTPRKQAQSSSATPVDSSATSSATNGADITVEVLSYLSEDLNLNPQSGSGKRACADARAREARFAVPPEQGGGVATHTPETESTDAESDAASWRRDVPGVNAEKFSEWVGDLEQRGKRLGPKARVFAARYLADQGDHATQATIVDFCMMQEYKRLVPIADIQREQNRTGSNGTHRRTRAQETTAALARIKQLADELPGECEL